MNVARDEDDVAKPRAECSRQRGCGPPLIVLCILSTATQIYHVISTVTNTRPHTPVLISIMMLCVWALLFSLNNVIMFGVITLK